MNIYVSLDVRGGGKSFGSLAKKAACPCLGVLREEEGKRKGGEFHKQYKI
jgi:hypothetical protein